MKTKQALRSAGRQGTQCAFGPDVRGAAVLPARPGDGLPAVPAPPASLACVPHHFPTQHRPDPWDSVCTPRSLPTSRRVRRRTQDSCVHAAPWPHPVRWGPLFPPREGPMAQLVRPQVSAPPRPALLRASPPPRQSRPPLGSQERGLAPPRPSIRAGCRRRPPPGLWALLA